MPSDIFDLIIVGGGVSGCATAINLPPGINALLIDRGSAGNGRCCGGLIAPDARYALENIKLKIPDSIRVNPEPQFVRVRDYDSGLTQNYRRDYLNINRTLFDRWLLELAKERVDFKDRTHFIDGVKEGDYHRVRVSSNGKKLEYLTRFIVGADGANSKVRRNYFPDRSPIRTYLALQNYLPPHPALVNHEVIFDSSLTDFYAWAIPEDENVIIGSAFKKRFGARSRIDEITGRFLYEFGLDNRIVKRQARLITRPEKMNDFYGGSDGVILVGESAGLISASSGEGISYAIESGATAGRAFHSPEPSLEYNSKFKNIAWKVCRKFVKARVIFTPALRRFALRIPWYP
jgi:flavin-dependent dehydrogenase